MCLQSKLELEIAKKATSSWHMQSSRWIDDQSTSLCETFILWGSSQYLGFQEWRLWCWEDEAAQDVPKVNQAQNNKETHMWHHVWPWYTMLHYFQRRGHNKWTLDTVNYVHWHIDILRIFCSLELTPPPTNHILNTYYVQEQLHALWDFQLQRLPRPPRRPSRQTFAILLRRHRQLEAASAALAVEVAAKHALKHLVFRAVKSALSRNGKISRWKVHGIFFGMLRTCRNYCWLSFVSLGNNQVADDDFDSSFELCSSSRSWLLNPQRLMPIDTSGHIPNIQKLKVHIFQCARPCRYKGGSNLYIAW